MLPACTVILYRADPTVRVRTEPALREVIPTREWFVSVLDHRQSNNGETADRHSPMMA